MNAFPDTLSFIANKGAYVFAFDFGRYLIAACLVAAVVWVMMRTGFKSRKIQKRRATMSDLRREVLQSVQSCIVYVIVTFGVIWARNNGLLQPITGSQGWSMDLMLLGGLILAHDAYFYWMHRALHTPLLYKTFHHAHHRSITPTPFAAYSFAIPEAFAEALIVVIWVAFVATPGWVLFAFLAFQITRNAMGHAGVELMPRWWLSTPLTRWINTTTHHDLHHNGGFNKNYGLYFTFWDKIMGTEHPKYAESFARVVAPVASSHSQGTMASPSPSL
jgi:Delta7-sterol 5-desaturase